METTSATGSLGNPLLEEYVDCLHFILSIGLELVIDPTLNWDDITTDESDITRKFLDITQESFADEIGLKRNSVALIERGKRNPSEKTLKEIRERFNVNKEWLLDGSGQVFNDDHKDHYLFNLCGKLCNSDNDLLKDTFIQVMNLDEKYLKMFNAMLGVVLSQNKE